MTQVAHAHNLAWLCCVSTFAVAARRSLFYTPYKSYLSTLVCLILDHYVHINETGFLIYFDTSHSLYIRVVLPIFASNHNVAQQVILFLIIYSEQEYTHLLHCTAWHGKAIEAQKSKYFLLVSFKLLEASGFDFW